MSFFEYLEKLRGKPERERRRVLVLTATIITAIIVIIWAKNISFQFQAKPPAKSVPTPLQVIGQTLGEGIKGIREKIKSEFATSTIYQTQQ